MTFAERFGRNLREARDQLAISQEGLELRAEVHRTQISKFERGKGIPQIDTLVRLASGLGLKPEDLLGGLGWQQPRPAVPGVMVIADDPGEQFAPIL